MILSIKGLIEKYGIAGDILLYREGSHRKKEMAKYLASKLSIPNETEIHTYSNGAFGLYLAKAFPDIKVNTYCGGASKDYLNEMVSTKNLRIISNMDYLSFKEMGFGGIVIDQYTNKLVLEYYKLYFNKLVKLVSNYKIDAFCDCGHSCATLAGFVASNFEKGLVKWDFVLGCVIKVPRTNIYHLEPYRDKILFYSTREFDTYKLEGEIERMWPEFGNVFEATRSISAAMAYLVENPGKTVLVWVGDSFDKPKA